MWFYLEMGFLIQCKPNLIVGQITAIFKIWCMFSTQYQNAFISS